MCLPCRLKQCNTLGRLQAILYSFQFEYKSGSMRVDFDMWAFKWVFFGSRKDRAVASRPTGLEHEAQTFTSLSCMHNAHVCAHIERLCMCVLGEPVFL